MLHDDPSSASGRPALRLLALGTSTDWCAVALYLRGAGSITVHRHEERAGQMQSRRLLPIASGLLEAQGLTFGDLDAVAFDAGPGAFTGLRIGCGVAQGVGFALSLPLVPVGSLEALAWQADAERVFAATDARMGEVYCGGFVRVGGRPEPVGPVQASPADDPGALVARWREEVGEPSTGAVAIGDAFSRHPAMAERFLAEGFQVVQADFPGAEAIAMVGAARFDAGRFVAARDAAPVYVRDKVALDVDEQRRLREARAVNAAGAK